MLSSLANFLRFPDKPSCLVSLSLNITLLGRRWLCKDSRLHAYSCYTLPVLSLCLSISPFVPLVLSGTTWQTAYLGLKSLPVLSLYLSILQYLGTARSVRTADCMLNPVIFLSCLCLSISPRCRWLC